MVFAEKNGRRTTTTQCTISEALDTIFYEDWLSAGELRNKDIDKVYIYAEDRKYKRIEVATISEDVEFEERNDTFGK